MRRTKILATIGPASNAPNTLRELLRAGADAVRLNFSHGTDDEHRLLLRRAHEAAHSTGSETAIVGDVQGPKIRIGPISGGAVTLRDGQTWTLDHRTQPGNRSRVQVEIPGLARAARPGDPMLLGDGNVELIVVRASASSLEARVLHGGPVASHAGLFLPRARLRESVFAAKDRHDAEVGLGEGIDFLALSFVSQAEDLLEARRWLDAHDGGQDVGLIAKIERAEALHHFDRILEVADGVMVARGDLGIELPLERLALEQKRLVRRANLAGRFVIVATQMLLSMVHAPRPTRAEATDVANAVLDGADAVMLSEESAVGDYPVDAVRWLDRIARATEGAFDPRPLREAEAAGFPRAESGVAAAAVRLAEGVGARAIVTPTHSGKTARLVARQRPSTPVVALSSLASTRRKLSLVSGVIALPAPVHQDLIDLRANAAQLVEERHIGSKGPIVLTAGYPVMGRPTNLLTLVEPEDARPEASWATRAAPPRSGPGAAPRG